MPSPNPAGTFATSDWVSLECLRFLSNMMAMAGYANFGYQDEFKKNFAVGDTVTVKFPQEYLVTDGFEYNPTGIDRLTTTVTVDQPMQVSFGYDSIEEALSLERSKDEISEQYIKPAIGQLASEIELRFMNFAFFNTPNVVGALGSIPNTWTTYATVRQRMVELATFAGQKNVIGITPAMMRTFAAAQLSSFNPSSEISRLYKQGSAGTAAGLDWFESVYCHQHTTGDVQVQASVTVNAAGQSGSELDINCTSGDTFKRGDIISIDNVEYVNPRTKVGTGTDRQFVITQDVTATAATATLPIYPSIVTSGPYQNVSAGPGNAAAITFWPGTTYTNSTPITGICGLAFNKLAFAIAGVELMMPQEGGSVKMARQKKDPNTGISIALISEFDSYYRAQINRLDCLIGFGALYADRAAVRVASSS